MDALAWLILAPCLYLAVVCAASTWQSRRRPASLPANLGERR